MHIVTRITFECDENPGNSLQVGMASLIKAEGSGLMLIFVSLTSSFFQDRRLGNYDNDAFPFYHVLISFHFLHFIEAVLYST